MHYMSSWLRKCIWKSWTRRDSIFETSKTHWYEIRQVSGSKTSKKLIWTQDSWRNQNWVIRICIWTIGLWPCLFMNKCIYVDDKENLKSNSLVLWYNRCKSLISIAEWKGSRKFLRNIEKMGPNEFYVTLQALNKVIHAGGIEIPMD